jgi:uncharacterized phiE125 gp8 family phage protein
MSLWNVEAEGDWSLRLITPPAEEPVTLDEAKQHLRVEMPDEDALILGLIAAARAQVETRTKRALATQTWELGLESFCWSDSPWGVCSDRGSSHRLPWPALQSVTSITYLDATGTRQTLSTSVYQVITGTPGRVGLAYGQSWPVVRSEPDSVLIRYVAGYGGASAVPDALKAAIKLLVGHLYENREATISGLTITELPMAVRALCDTECWGGYG